MTTPSSLEHAALWAAGLGAWAWDIGEDRLTCSDGALSMLGLAAQRAGLRTAELLELAHEDDRAALGAALQQARSTSQLEVSFRLRAYPGRWINARGRALADAVDHGMLVGVVQDVSGSHAQEQAHSELRSLMQAALDASAFAVTVLNPKGQIIYCNELGASLLGLTPSAAEERTYDAPQFEHTDVDGGPWPDAKQPFVRVMTTGQPVQGVEHRIRRPDGRSILLRINGAPVKNERGEIKLLVFSYEDITERRAIEEGFRQAQKMDAIGRFAGGIAHDFNNLLTAMLSYAALARAEIDESARVLDSLDGIEEAATRAGQLTRQLLAFARQQPSRSISFDARVETAAAVRLIERLVGDRVEVGLKSWAEPCWVCLDPTQLQQVLLNLAVNARDAMPDGGKLNLSIERVEPATVRLTITDTGHGMDSETLQRAFDPYFTTKGPHEGTGLGLATSHGIIAQAGGQLVLESELGHGTRAEITLPLASPPAAVRDTPAPRRRNPRVPARILLIEENPAVRRVTIQALEREGYLVRSAVTGAHALSLLEAEPCELIICDLGLPGLSGQQFAERVAQLQPNARVLFVSGQASELTRGEQSRILAKPYTPERLLEQVTKALEPSTTAH